MSYLPDIYKHFERAFPTVHAAHQELARRCYEVGPLDERSARLVKLGIAIGAQAEGAVRPLARPPRARRADASGGAPRCRPTRPDDDRFAPHGGRARLDRGSDRKQICCAPGSVGAFHLTSQALLARAAHRTMGCTPTRPPVCSPEFV